MNIVRKIGYRVWEWRAFFQYMQDLRIREEENIYDYFYLKNPFPFQDKFFESQLVVKID